MGYVAPFKHDATLLLPRLFLMHTHSDSLMQMQAFELQHSCSTHARDTCSGHVLGVCCCCCCFPAFPSWCAGGARHESAVPGRGAHLRCSENNLAVTKGVAVAVPQVSGG